jgi:hypothetical protein
MKTLEQNCVCGKAMADDVCSDANCRYNVALISAYETAALDAITGGKTMGQMLRSFPANTPKDELQKYGEAYDRLRKEGMIGTSKTRA